MFFLAPMAAGAAATAAPAAASLTPSLIAGGAGLLGSVINAGSQLGTNSSQLSYAREMYDKQRADALADWNMQNQYNSPKEQMARFKEAGLNPNLIYGQMSNSPVVRTSSPQSYSPTAPQVDLVRPAGMAIDAYYDTQLKAAQTDNVKAMAEGARVDNLLKGYDLLKKSEDSKYYEGTARTLYNKLVSDAGLSLYDLQYNRPAQTDLIKAQTNASIAMRNLNDAQKFNVEATLKNIRTQGEILELEKKLKEWDVKHQDISNIINWAQKLLGLVPGIGGLLKR